MDCWRWWCEIIIAYFACNTPCENKLSDGRILLLFIIHEDGTINENEETFSSFLWFFQSLHNFLNHLSRSKLSIFKVMNSNSKTKLLFLEII